MLDPPRPTIRCLFEDLTGDVEDPEQRSALQARHLPALSIRLHDIAHPIVAAARDRYTEGEPRPRDWYRSVRDHPWVECRHGERLRGLVLWRPEEQRWLCFAGWHESNSPRDIYARFTRACTTGSRIDSSHFLPKEEDEIRLQGERKYLERVTERQQFGRVIVECLVEAVSKPEATSEGQFPDGSTMRATLRAAGDLEELILQIDIDWQGGVGAALFDRITEAVPGIAPTEWEVLPPGPANLDPAFFCYVDSEWAQRLIASAAEHGADILGINPHIMLDPSDGAAHIVIGRSTVTAAYVDGQALRSLCGRRFVPSTNPEAADPCPECEEIKETTREFRR